MLPQQREYGVLLDFLRPRLWRGPMVQRPVCKTDEPSPLRRQPDFLTKQGNALWSCTCGRVTEVWFCAAGNGPIQVGTRVRKNRSHHLVFVWIGLERRSELALSTHHRQNVHRPRPNGQSHSDFMRPQRHPIARHPEHAAHRDASSNRKRCQDGLTATQTQLCAGSKSQMPRSSVPRTQEQNPWRPRSLTSV